MGHGLKILLGAAAASILASGFAGLADAGTCKGRHCKKERYADEPGIIGYVTAEQTIGSKTVTAPVREGRWGHQVRVGPNWYDCEITCEYTLRRMTVDFWDGQGSGRFVSPGYFRFDFDLDTGEFYRRGPRFLGRF